MNPILKAHFAALIFTALIMVSIIKFKNLFVIVTISLIVSYFLYYVFKFIKNKTSSSELRYAYWQSTIALFLVLMPAMVYYLTDNYIAYKHLIHKEEIVNEKAVDEANERIDKGILFYILESPTIDRTKQTP